MLIIKKENNMYCDINNTLINSPEECLDMLCSADTYKDLISEIQFRTWNENF